MNCRLVDSFPEILKVYEYDDLGEMFWDANKDGWVLV